MLRGSMNILGVAVEIHDIVQPYLVLVGQFQSATPILSVSVAILPLKEIRHLMVEL